jgi:hypothetical protein
MTKTEKKDMNEALAEALEADLLRQYGPMLTGDSLRKALGYPSMDALRQAVSRGTVPVPIFPLEKRRGKFALAKDVANWLAEQRNSAIEKDS